MESLKTLTFEDDKTYCYETKNEIIFDIIKFWFPNCKHQDFWMNGTKDEIIIEKYSSVLTKAENGELDFLMDLPLGKITLLVLLDQFTRNINRGDNIRKNDHISLEISKTMIETGEDIKYPLCMRLFVLLPLRHSKQSKYLDIVMNKIKEYNVEYKNEKQQESMLKRFHFATLRDYSKVTDTISVNSDPKRCNILKYILDTKCHDYFDNVSSSLSDSFSYVPEKTLDGYSIFGLKEMETNVVYQCIYKWVKANNFEKKRFVISLSGGVDSMVMFYVFYQLKLRDVIDDFYSVHLNYGNREVSYEEAEFVDYFARLFGIKSYVRNITHFKRHEIERDVYEDETKRIRFGLYKYVIENTMSEGACLGHHCVDKVESILMNICRGRDIIDLSMMSDSSLIDDVNIFRPMLQITKDDIFDFAKEYKIPFLEDTTPSHCYRKCLRDFHEKLKLVDPSYTSNVEKVAKKSQIWGSLIYTQIMEPVLKSIIYGKMGFYFPIGDLLLKSPSLLWSKLFMAIFHSQKMKTISIKKINMFLSWFAKNNKSVMFINKNFICVKQNKTVYFVNSKIVNKIDICQFPMTETFSHKITTPTYTFDTTETSDIRVVDDKDLTLNELLIKTSCSSEIPHVDVNVVTLPNGEIDITYQTYVVTKEKIDKKITMEDIINGELVYTFPVFDTNMIELSYCISKRNRTKKIFMGLGNINSFIPKIYGVSAKNYNDSAIRYMKAKITLSL